MTRKPQRAPRSGGRSTEEGRGKPGGSGASKGEPREAAKSAKGRSRKKPKSSEGDQGKAPSGKGKGKGKAPSGKGKASSGKGKGKAPSGKGKAPSGKGKGKGKSASRPAKPREERRPPRLPPAVEPDIGAGAHRCGYVALVGRPNVGKSTLLNQLLGQKIAATTHKPQTTRRNLMGVLHPRGAQILLLDTPGHHSARGPLNRFMVGQVRTALRDADVLGYVVEAREDGNVTPGNEGILEEVVKSGKPVVLIINKIDRVNDKERLLLQMQTFRERLQAQLQDIVPISATRRDGLEQTVIALGRALPEGEPLYDGELITDASERAIVAELIREKVMLETRQELPYAAAITIDAFEDDRPRIVRVMASLHVERSSQKAIVIGKGGERLKAIGQRARFEMENFLGSKVFLDLHVRTTERWTERPEKMAGLGYEEDAG